MRCERDLMRAVRRAPGGDVYAYREALREQYRIADAKWTRSGYTSKSARGALNRARFALQESLGADAQRRDGVKRDLTLFELLD